MINVLSLFDGISCGRVALERAGISVDKYYASEIDKYAVSITQKNYPDTIQLGDVTKIDFTQLEGKIDLLIGGSPCTGFSRAGKGLNFEDPQSRLFWYFVEALNVVKPKYFLLENVKMKKEWQDIITEEMGVEPILIDSAKVSAQRRKRLYWTNIPDIKQPEDKGILLRDIILSDADPVILHNLYGGFKEKSVRVFEDKSPTIRTSAGGGHIPSVVKSDLFVSPEKLKDIEFKENYIQWDATGKGYGSQDQRAYYLFKKHGTLPSCSAGSKVKVALLTEEQIEQLKHSQKALDYMDRKTKDGRTHWDFAHYSDIRDDKSSTVVANFFKGIPYNVFKDWNCIRKLHPIECERLQTLVDNYTAEGISEKGKKVKISNTQRYKCIGNGWTVDVISHIFSYLKKCNN